MKIDSEAMSGTAAIIRYWRVQDEAGKLLRIFRVRVSQSKRALASQP